MNINDWLEGNRKRQLGSFLASLREEKTQPNKAKRMEKSKKEKSWTQRDYESAYAWMRRGVSFEWLARNDSLISLEAVKAADYSYQAKDYWVTGWVNKRRQDKFAIAMLHNKHSVWGIPF